MQHDYALIQVTTDDDLILNALYKPGEQAKTACILIHGFTGDFYTHQFFHAIADALKAQGNALVLAQTRGTGLHTEFIRPNGDSVYIGSLYERLEDAHLDITAFIKFLESEGYQKITLIGHSLGTIKAVRYLSEGELASKVSRLVLLAPFDKNAFLARRAADKRDDLLATAQARIQAGRGKELVPVPEYEDYAMSYETFYSWYSHSELGSLWDFYRQGYDFPALHKITVPLLAVLGEQDEFTSYPEFHESPAAVLELINRHNPGAETVLIKDCGHTFRSQETAVAEAVASFVENQLGEI